MACKNPDGPCGCLEAHEPETIERAAIRYSGIVYSVPRPGRHGEVVAKINTFYPEPRPQGLHQDQGFYTNLGRFVDREEAMVIAKRANQLLDEEAMKRVGGSRLFMLFSEDVW